MRASSLRQNRNVPWNLNTFTGQVVADDRAERRVRYGWVGPVTGLHCVRSAAFVVAFLAPQRPHQRYVFHLVGKLFKPGSQLHAFGGSLDGFGPAGDVRAGLRVEGFELASARRSSINTITDFAGARSFPAAHCEHRSQRRQPRERSRFQS